MTERGAEGRVMAIDYGRVRVGVAVTDPTRTIARGLETIVRRDDNRELIERLLILIDEYEIKKIILGMPLRTDGKISEMEIETKKFSRELQEASGLRPIFRDERFSSVIASRILGEQNVKKDKKKAVLDQLAAEIILRSWLDEQLLKRS